MRFPLACISLAFLVMACSPDKKATGITLTNDPDSLSYYTGIYTASNLLNLGADSLNSAVFKSALREVLDNNEQSISLADANHNIGWFFDKLRTLQKEKNLREGRAYSIENTKNTNISTTASGLQYEVIKMGTGFSPCAGDQIVVKYLGKTLSGDIFLNHTDKADTIKLDKETVILGLYEGLQMMPAGSRFLLHLPTHLAFDTIPAPLPYLQANMSVVFDVELLSIVH